MFRLLDIFRKRSIDEKTLRENEYAANRALSYGCAFAAILTILIWIFYITGIFQLSSKDILLVLNIALPLSSAVLVLPLVFLKTKIIKKPFYKYFVLSLFILIVTILNVLVAKHALLAWAVIILIACHYYSPRTSLIVYIIVAVMMLFSIYMAMLFGEWDPYLMGSMDNVGASEAQLVETYDLNQRLEYLNKCIELGENRYLKVLVYYYMSRMVLITLMFFISLQLSARTDKMMKTESDLHREKEKVSNELNIASAIQGAVLPRDFPSTNEYELFAIMDPAREVGGDFYDFYLTKTNEVIFTIGDVSGKGIPSSLQMMGTKTLLKTYTRTGLSLDRALEETNREICEFNKTGMFVTAVTAKLNLYNGDLILANAGHNPILLKRDGKFEFIKLPAGFVLGGYEETKFKAVSYNLKPGDQVFFYTDGVTEATNKDNEIFGEERLLNVLNANAELRPEELTKKVQEEINNFVGDAEQFDDITIISVLYKGSAVIKKEITVDSLSENLQLVTEFVNENLSHYTDNKRALNQINVAIDELFSNIVKFAYNPEVGKAIVRIEIRQNPVSVAISFIDKGRPFNPLELENPDITLDADERAIGGLGIFIVRQSMDEITYEYKDNQNILTIKKRL